MWRPDAELFRRIASGVHVIGVAAGGRRNGFTAAWVMQLSFQPPLLGLSINPDHASYALLIDGGTFTVNVLERGQLDLARHFGVQSARTVDKLAGIGWHAAASGAPVLDDCLAYYDCRVVARHSAGDHELVIGRVVDGAVHRPNAAALLYAETGDLDGSSALYPAADGDTK